MSHEPNLQNQIYQIITVETFQKFKPVFLTHPVDN